MIRAALIDAHDRWGEYEFALDRVTNLQIVAAVESDADAQFTELVRPVRISRSFSQLLAEHGPEFDAVAIHSPVPHRSELIRQAAAAQKHVFVDTPMARSAAEARAATAACNQAGVRLMVNQPLRFMPFQQVAQDRLQAGKLGRPGLLRIHHWSTAAGSHAADPQRADTDILELVHREVDTACWLFDAAPHSVFAVAVASPEGSAPSGVQLHLGFPGGGMALIDCLRNHSQSYEALTLIGSQGAVYADDHHNTNLLLHAGDATALNVGQGRDHAWSSLQEFVNAVSDHRDPACTGRDGERAITVVQAAIDSLAAGSPAKLVGDHYELR